MSILIKPAYDADASTYFTTAGVTSVAGRQQISRFVTGIKDLGLWSSMVCWPLRSSQNAGTGTTAYSLGGLGTYNGTFTNGPTWGVDGVNFNIVNAYILVALTLAQPLTIIGSLNFKTLTNAGSLIDGQSRITIFNGGTSAQAELFAGSGIATGASKTFSTGWNFLGGYASGASSVIYLNQHSTTGNAGANSIGSTNIIIGNNNPLNFGNKNLDISFCSIFTGNQDFQSLRTLYKTTLGQGLGLP